SRTAVVLVAAGVGRITADAGVGGITAARIAAARGAAAEVFGTGDLAAAAETPEPAVVSRLPVPVDAGAELEVAPRRGGLLRSERHSEGEDAQGQDAFHGGSLGEISWE